MSSFYVVIWCIEVMVKVTGKVTSSCWIQTEDGRVSIRREQTQALDINHAQRSLTQSPRNF